MFIIGELGIATLIATTIGLFMGGQPVAAGFRANYDVLNNQFNITPQIVLQMPQDFGGAFTLAGTAFIFDTTILNKELVYKYEMEHTNFYQQFGLIYPLYAFGEGCKYDPLSRMSLTQCSDKLWNTQRTVNPRYAPQNFSSFSIKF